MKKVPTRTGRLAALVMVAIGQGATGTWAQTTTIPSTLRYGSGLIDIPVASVLPHLEITGTYSGFFVKLDRTVQVGPSGRSTGFAPSKNAFHQDGSVAVGLFDRTELGLSIQSLGGTASGGDVWGLFGRLQLVRPSSQGLGLAVGGRYVTGPDFGDGIEYEPNRLGWADRRFRHSYPGGPTVGTKLSLYGVASAHVRGLELGLLPKSDLTFTLGYGSGMFKGGHGLDFYDYASSKGWFFGSAATFQAARSSILTLMGEYDGFDVNLGAQVDVHGVRVGAQYLAANYAKPPGGYYSEYRSPKLGLLVSLALCPGSGGLLCKPRLLERPQRQVVQLPAPPPDTVVVTREVAPPPPDGTPATICLSTGEVAHVWVSARGDTLIGPGRTPVRALRPGVAFAGTYAAAAPWYGRRGPVVLEGRSYDRSGKGVRRDCARIRRVGEYAGVPLFAERGTERPWGTIYVPVRPGVWHAYRQRSGRTGG